MVIAAVGLMPSSERDSHVVNGSKRRRQLKSVGVKRQLTEGQLPDRQMSADPNRRGRAASMENPNRMIRLEVQCDAPAQLL